MFLGEGVAGALRPAEDVYIVGMDDLQHLGWVPPRGTWGDRHREEGTQLSG